ncbi:hypothetical protein [Pedomonas sp. V897]|uniref:hypothetical protein n=1 Tax=Pedomonas sp. V897 TaxID=3446482 RepID=UPI003EE3C494
MDWPEPGKETGQETRWTLDRAAQRLMEVVTSHPMSTPAAFRFRWRSGRYEINVEETDSAVIMRLTGIVGTVPFTSEDPSSRRRVLDTLRHMRDLWPCAGLTLTGGEVRLRREIPYTRPVSFRQMVADVTSALLPVQPVIELIESDLWPAA